MSGMHYTGSGICPCDVLLARGNRKEDLPFCNIFHASRKEYCSVCGADEWARRVQACCNRSVHGICHCTRQSPQVRAQKKMCRKTRQLTGKHQFPKIELWETSSRCCFAAVSWSNFLKGNFNSIPINSVWGKRIRKTRAFFHRSSVSSGIRGRLVASVNRARGARQIVLKQKHDNCQFHDYLPALELASMYWRSITPPASSSREVEIEDFYSNSMSLEVLFCEYESKCALDAFQQSPKSCIISLNHFTRMFVDSWTCPEINNQQNLVTSENYACTDCTNARIATRQWNGIHLRPALASI